MRMGVKEYRVHHMCARRMLTTLVTPTLIYRLTSHAQIQFWT